MPIYEYKCNACKKTFEKRIEMANRLEKQICPECGQQQGIKILSSVNMLASSEEISNSCADGQCGINQPNSCGGCCGGECGI